jgi:hypothetical protein
MSADNQISILKDSENKFRVSQTFVSGESFEDPEWVFREFKDSEVFLTEEEAVEEAVEMEEKVGYVEYGLVEEIIDYPFPKPVLEVQSINPQDILAVYGYMKWEFPYIPIFMEETENRILILSGEYGTSLNWLKAKIEGKVNGILISFKKEE